MCYIYIHIHIDRCVERYISIVEMLFIINTSTIINHYEPLEYRNQYSLYYIFVSLFICNILPSSGFVVYNQHHINNHQSIWYVSIRLTLHNHKFQNFIKAIYMKNIIWLYCDNPISQYCIYDSYCGYFFLFGYDNPKYHNITW